jgi:hypothetical protein
VREIGGPSSPRRCGLDPIDSAEDERVVVAVALGSVVADAPDRLRHRRGCEPDRRRGRSTLDALNRRLAQVL